ncbi:FtsP/CotA-like multicopper oxidase with cupredoxin domain [Streptomyces sp. B4I13]|uniref:multicopper oxidase family protein n=1 Tax=Streptomyces sp. B4I13 TaxID=3042271 RepID=UPI0027899CF5|nr:multicopper oxidase domain-containing protein [Streptomyces sp. B4I13]MDQ0961062.1 FtsP/CotA-like multicopper oxidase with cupredoxin domain [Streptomyces sp. B4I13]
MTSLARRDVLKCLPVVAGAAVTGAVGSGAAGSGAAVAAPGVALDAGATRAAVRAVGGAGFPQPETRRADPDTGRLVTRLTVAFTELAVPGVGRVLTRTYEGSVPGPTLRVRPTETLEITQVNALPPDTATTHHEDVNVPHHFNTFNLHTHGLHVDPEGESDNVFRSFEPAGAPGETTTYRSTVDIPEGHPAGTFWYHPHHHGSTSTQVLNGMAGVIVVEGDVDDVPEIAAAREVVLCVSELKLSGERVPDLTSHGIWDGITSTFLVNGAKNPVLTIAPGEIQRWRVVNAGALTAHFLSLGGVEMHQIACDGVAFMKPVVTTGVTLPMGGRVDLLVRGGRPGTYRLTGGGPSQHLLTLVVTGAARSMSLPDALPGRPTELPEPTRTRRLIFRSNENVFSGAFPNAYQILGDGETPPADPEAGRGDLAWGRPCADYVNQRVRLGEVEEWTIVNDSHAHGHHPFHLHTNHFLLTAVDNRKLATPVWHDTVAVPPNGSITFRLRAEDFTGRSMLHCHQLQHGDEGMMQVVEYVN